MFSKEVILVAISTCRKPQMWGQIGDAWYNRADVAIVLINLTWTKITL